jgi:hypothetical protein
MTTPSRLSTKWMIILSICSFLPFSIHAQSSEASFEVSCIGFYNVENLFDTLDTEDKYDEEFTPAGKNAWGTNRYQHKLDQLGKVIADLGTQVHPQGLAILGVAEVENIQALEDLSKNRYLTERGYEVILEEGPDRRGIDVGMLYNPEHFKPTGWKSVTLNMADTSFRTRDQLVVSGLLDGSPIHVIVAHWPSRSGGQKRSEPNRMAAADLGRSIIDSLTKVSPGVPILYMGDLNDDPINKSLVRSMRATGDPKFVTSDRLYNPMYDMYNKGVGSLAWRDTWNLFDQIIMNDALLDEKNTGWRYHTTRVYNKPYLTTAEGNFKGYPFRTFAGGAWTAGYSDHFPVYVVLKRMLP